MLTFSESGRWETAGVQIDLRRSDLAANGEDVRGGRAQQMLESLEARWREQLPTEADELWTCLNSQPQSKVLELCAFCVALSLNGVTANEEEDPLRRIGSAAGLDMREWWLPTAEAYPRSVPKARILEAMGEAGLEADSQERSLKKSELAARAEQRLAGTWWLPALL